MEVIRYVLIVIAMIIVACGIFTIAVKIADASNRRHKAADADLDYSQAIAKMQFKLWWENQGLPVVNDYIVNNGIGSVRAETIRHEAKQSTNIFIIHQLTMKATRHSDRLIHRGTFSGASRRKLASAIIERNKAARLNEEALSGYGYDVEDLTKIFQQ